MKTAKQINDQQTGEIIPMAISGTGFKQKFHPLTCSKCHEVINTALCAKCQLDCTHCKLKYGKEIAKQIFDELEKANSVTTIIGHAEITYGHGLRIHLDGQDYWFLKQKFGLS